MFEKFKQRIQEKIEKNTIKSTLHWTDKEGKVYEEEVLLKRSRMPLIGDWVRIYPPINEDGSINWINLVFGGKKNFIKLLLIFAIIAMVLLQFNELFNVIKALREEPCFKFCLNNPIGF